MASFTHVNKHTQPLTTVNIPNGKKTRFHLVGVLARVATDISLTSSNESVVKPSILNSPYDGPKGIWIVDFTAASEGSAEIKANHKSAVAATVSVTVFKPVTLALPGIGTNEGMFARLLLAESSGPGKSGYDADNARTAMQWMRLVIHNRRTHKTPGIFNAKKGSNNVWDDRDIVTAGGQFHGFDQYPGLPADITSRIEDILRVANNYDDSRRDSYAKFVQNALEVAKSTAMIKDPCPTGLYGWRTQGSSHPGGSFEKYKDFAGQTFYTLKK